MDYRQLGRSGLKVSPLCLGTMTFGEADEKSFMHKVGCDEDTSFRIMNRALELGVNFFDTADIYGQDGLSERVIGKWLARDGRRNDVVLATKFRFRMEAGPNGTGASRYHIMRACEGSLKRLGTDRIDLYQIHMQDLDTPEEETLRALDDLVHQGKVLYLGASNYAAYRLVESLWIADKLGLARFVSFQPQYSLLMRDIEREHVPACEKFGVGIIPWSPLAGGFLSGKYRRGEAAPPGSRLEKWKQGYQQFDNDRGWTVLDTVNAIATELGKSPTQIALAWLLAKRGVTSPIFGARSLDQLEANVAATAIQLSPEHMATLDTASQVPIGYPYDFIQRTTQNRW